MKLIIIKLRFLEKFYLDEFFKLTFVINDKIEKLLSTKIGTFAIFPLLNCSVS